MPKRVSRRLNVSATNDQWVIYDALRARGSSPDEIFSEGLNKLVGRIQREEAMIAPTATAIRAWIYLVNINGIMRPRTITRFRGRKKNVVEVIIYAITRHSKDEQKPIGEQDFKVEYKVPSMEDQHYVTRKKGRFIEQYILNHFGFME